MPFLGHLDGEHGGFCVRAHGHGALFPGDSEWGWLPHETPCERIIPCGGGTGKPQLPGRDAGTRFFWVALLLSRFCGANQ